MGIDFPNSPSSGDTYTYEGETYRYNGVAFVKVRERVTTFNGVTGAIVGVNSVNGETGDVTLSVGGSDGVQTFNGSTGSIEGVSTFNGATGAIIGVTSVQGKTGDVTLTDLEITHGVETFNGLSGSVEGVSTFNGATGAIIGVTSVQGKTGDVTLTDLEITHGVETFNGLSGSIDTTSLILPVTGISGPAGITFSNGEVIRNNPDGSIQILPNDSGAGHYGVEIDATEWGHGPTITAIEEDGSQVGNAIRLDSDIVMGLDDASTTSRIMFDTSQDRGFQKVNHNDGTVAFGVNDNFGHFAVMRKDDMADVDRSMSTDDKNALGMDNPQFLVYSSDATNANDYIRLEHDQTDANIYSGTGIINLAPAGGAVGISGGGLDIKASGITFADSTQQKGAAKDVATFTISASSAITTDSKTNAMYRMPYNATLLGLQGKITANGNIRGTIDIAGPDFGNPTTGHASAIGFQHTSGGNTFDHSSIDQASVDAGDYLYIDVTNNASGATGAQFFVTYETR